MFNLLYNCSPGLKARLSNSVYMKRVVSAISIVLVSCFLFPQSASAHLFGQPPFFKIDGDYSNFYHVPLTSLYNFDLPQDGASRDYLVGENIDFAFDVNRLPAPPDVVEKTKFNWDFGDGTTAHGLSNTHAYKKMGSYTIHIYADDGTTPTPQLLESVFLNVLPSKDYPLPKAVIKINNEESKDPLTDILHLPFGTNLHFDATSSEDKKASIKSYFWDFGDQKSSSKAIDTHSYPKSTNQIFAVLRVTDSNGFIADNFVEVKNGNSEPAKFSPSPTIQAISQKKPGSSAPFWVFILAGVFILLVMVRLFARGRGRGKRQ